MSRGNLITLRHLCQSGTSGIQDECASLARSCGRPRTVPVLIEGAPDLDAAISRVNALRENSSAEYGIVSQATGRRILFTAKDGMKRN
jgi:hypothetical protein